MTETVYDRRLERLRIQAHNDGIRSSPKYAVLCDLTGVYDSEDEERYLEGANQIEMTPGLADTLFDEFSPKINSGRVEPTSPERLTKKQLKSLPLSTLIEMHKGMIGPTETFDPGHGCRTYKARVEAFADAVYRKSR
tara:strand:- start:3027 stop:3437 length:411 start_codon:yes stop_codon:yes gene_type:complete